MSKLNERDKVVALAYLHQGRTPKEVEELCPGVSYAQALRLRKDLDEAIRDNTLTELFSLGDAALEALLQTVQDELQEAAEILTGDTSVLEGELQTISANVKATQILEAELADTASAIVKKLKLLAVSSNNSETLVNLAEAVAKLQTAFFKNSNIQIANINQGVSFEKFLQP